ncbi:MAG: hypothetical protein L7F78_01320 [Syntrophales bacterium LBB04]|nr:hypothetical protein [Syntrophales bacterium LBB04]
MKRVVTRVLGYIGASITLLNVALLAVGALAAFYVLLPLLRAHVTFATPRPRGVSGLVEGSAGQSQPPPLSNFLLIADQNLFHQERRIPPEKKEKPLPPKPDIVLYGTIIMDETLIAFVEDKKSPRTLPTRGKQQMPVKKGDVISGFTVTDIQPDRIVLTRGDEQVSAYVDDEQKRPAGSNTTKR